MYLILLRFSIQLHLGNSDNEIRCCFQSSLRSNNLKYFAETCSLENWGLQVKYGNKEKCALHFNAVCDYELIHPGLDGLEEDAYLRLVSSKVN